jgi:hypothetical protein
MLQQDRVRIIDSSLQLVLPAAFSQCSVALCVQSVIVSYVIRVTFPLYNLLLSMTFKPQSALSPFDLASSWLLRHGLF